MSLETKETLCPMDFKQFFKGEHCQTGNENGKLQQSSKVSKLDPGKK